MNQENIFWGKMGIKKIKKRGAKLGYDTVEQFFRIRNKEIIFRIKLTI
jgi:hypothetical protein